MRAAATMCPHPLTFDFLTLKVVSESRVTCVNFLGLSVLDIGPMCATDRQTSGASSLNTPYLGAGE